MYVAQKITKLLNEKCLNYWELNITVSPICIAPYNFLDEWNGFGISTQFKINDKKTYKLVSNIL